MSNQILLSYVSTEDKKDAVIIAHNNKTLTLKSGGSISLSKLDLIFSNKTLPEFVLPVQDKTIIGLDTYANTIYNFRITYCIEDGTTSFLDVNLKYKITDFNVSEDANGQLDNFNDCFKMEFQKFFNLLNKAISDTVAEAFHDTISTLTYNNYNQLSPTFEALDDCIKYYYIYENTANNTLRYYNTLDEFNNDITVGSFTFGFDTNINNMLFREWETEKAYDGFYYLNSNQLVNYNAEELVLTIDDNEEKYYIVNLPSPHFYEYSCYIKSFLYVVDGLNVSQMYLPSNNLSYSLINNTTNINSSLNVISILQPNTTRKGMFRLSYSNPDQRNNSSICDTETTFNTITATIYIIDKYNNIQKLQLHKGDSITSVICIQ